MRFVRRGLVLVAIAFWLGGFTFYTAVVVPIGAEVLGSASAQGFITRRVTGWINVSCCVALIPLVWDAIATRSFWRWRLSCSLIVAVGVAALLILHPRLEALLDVETERVLDRSSFRQIHRSYLWISTMQWFAGVIYVLLTPAAWRAADRIDLLAGSANGGASG